MAENKSEKLSPVDLWEWRARRAETAQARAAVQLLEAREQGCAARINAHYKLTSSDGVDLDNEGAIVRNAITRITASADAKGA